MEIAASPLSVQTAMETLLVWIQIIPASSPSMEHSSLATPDSDPTTNLLPLDWLELLVSEKKNINKNIDAPYIAELINCAVIYGVPIGLLQKCISIIMLVHSDNALACSDKALVHL